MPYIVRFLGSAPNASSYWNRDAAIHEVRRRLGLPNGADIELYRQPDGTYQETVKVKMIEAK